MGFPWSIESLIHIYVRLSWLIEYYNAVCTAVLWCVSQVTRVCPSLSLPIGLYCVFVLCKNLRMDMCFPWFPWVIVNLLLISISVYLGSYRTLYSCLLYSALVRVAGSHVCVWHP